MKLPFNITDSFSFNLFSLKKSTIPIILLLFFTQTGTSQSYPGIYQLDDHFTRGLLRRAFNVPNEVISFGIYSNDLANTYLETNYHRNRLNSISNINYNTKSPEVLIADYHSRTRDLDQQINQITSTNKARIDRDIRYIGESLGQIAKKNNITTGDENADWIIKEVLISASQENQKRKYEAQMRQLRYEAKMELERTLRNKMEPIKKSVINENENLKDNYLKAAAFEVNPDKERYFFDCYKFHECFVKEVNKNYSYSNTNWLSPACNKPGVYYNSTLTKQDYITVAYRKKKLHDKFGDEVFMKATNMFLEAGLSENNKNPMAYMLKAELENDILKEKFYIELAYSLDKNNPKIRHTRDQINKRFTSIFFSSIRNGDLGFVEKSIQNKFQLGQTYSGETPVEAAIDSDQSIILKKLLQAIPDYRVFLSSNGYALVFHAAAVDASECVKTLKAMQVPLNYIDKNDRGVTALNIAIKNNNIKTARYLLTAYKEITPCIKYAKNSSKEDLNELSLFLNNQSTDYTAILNHFYPEFKANNYSKVKIYTTPNDASIYIDGDYTGRGKIQINELELNKRYSLEVKRPGLQSIKKDISPKKGLITQITVTLQKPPENKLTLKTRYSDGYQHNTWKDYYIEPTTLKKEKKRNKEFNDAQREVAREIAQQAANDYNKTINNKLYAINESINQKNKQIRIRNKELESHREFNLTYTPLSTSRKYSQNKIFLPVKKSIIKDEQSKKKATPITLQYKGYETSSVSKNSSNRKDTKSVSQTTTKFINAPDNNYSFTITENRKPKEPIPVNYTPNPQNEFIQTAELNAEKDLHGYIGTVTQKTGNILYVEKTSGFNAEPGDMVKIFSSRSNGNELIANGYISFVNKNKCTIEIQLINKKIFVGDLVGIK